MTTAETVPYMAGNYAPVADELTAYDLPVTGTVPPELSGWYLRNGPNPHDAAEGHWFFGDGMVHGVRIDGGRAVSYRNRWVRTKLLADGVSRANRADGTVDLTGGPANTHVVRHAGHTFALVESSFPYEITCDLETVGPYDFDGKLTTAMTAHPKTCPTTGELHFFGYAATEPYLTYHRADAGGELVLSRPVEVPGPTMMHDFALTARHVVFLDLPVVLRPEASGMPFRWHPEYGARLGLLRRDDPYGAVRWFDIDPCYVFHTLNAHEDGGRVVLYAMRYPELFTEDDRGKRATLWRWTVDPVAGTVTEAEIDGRTGEFPRIDDRLAGLDARYGVAVTAGTPGTETAAGALYRYDLSTGAVVTHRFGAGRTPGEAAFAPADGTPGGPGWLLSYVYDAAADRSDLVILDADDVAAPPVATVHLPARVPYGFHGNWIADR
jgi:carotenoid cleavage dioxygenase-like enzyme